MSMCIISKQLLEWDLLFWKGNRLWLVDKQGSHGVIYLEKLCKGKTLFISVKSRMGRVA